MNPDLSKQSFRERIIDCFRTELAEHLKTLNDGLDAVSMGTVKGEERAETLQRIYRAAHTMKGAARTVGVTIVEQMARSLESVLYALKTGTLEPSREIFHACRQVIEAIQAVQITYEKNEVIPPYQATQALMELEELWNPEIALEGIKHDLSQRQDT